MRAFEQTDAIAFRANKLPQPRILSRLVNKMHDQAKLIIVDWEVHGAKASFKRAMYVLVLSLSCIFKYPRPPARQRLLQVRNSCTPNCHRSLRFRRHHLEQKSHSNTLCSSNASDLILAARCSCCLQIQERSPQLCSAPSRVRRIFSTSRRRPSPPSRAHHQGEIILRKQSEVKRLFESNEDKDVTLVLVFSIVKSVSSGQGNNDHPRVNGSVHSQVHKQAAASDECPRLWGESMQNAWDLRMISRRWLLVVGVTSNRYKYAYQAPPCQSNVGYGDSEIHPKPLTCAYAGLTRHLWYVLVCNGGPQIVAS